MLGVFAFSGGKMVGFRSFPPNPKEIAERILSVLGGVPTEEHLQLVRDMLVCGHKKFTVESEGLAKGLRERLGDGEFIPEFPNEAGKVLRKDPGRVVGWVGVKDIDPLVREVCMYLSRKGVEEKAEEKDRLVINAVKTLDEIDKACNMICSILREWYSLHFPELDEQIRDHELYLELLVSLGQRENFEEEKLSGFGVPEGVRKKIARAGRGSGGTPLAEADMEVIKECGEAVLGLFRTRKRLAEYVDRTMARVAPNLRAVVGGLLGARLIALAGGLDRLARAPTSTIQLLGAEKALFRALKTKGKPPKHGVIYRFPQLRAAPRKVRGKIARALAGKVSIAARVDAMGGEYVGEKLGADLRRRIGEIMSKYERSKEALR